LKELPGDKGWAVIWTTTPWTIPANQALNVHPDFSYSLVQTERGLLILAADLREACLDRYGLTERRVLGECKGKALERINFRHPFYDRMSPVYLGDYVTLDTGTGIVHSAPAYGIEDFNSCRGYGLKDDDILAPVQGDGRYAESLPLFGGLNIWKANPKIVETIKEHGALFHSSPEQHSYMHCWRHKTPIIYRATTQWFAGMDEVQGFNGVKPREPLRVTALRGVEATTFYPAWGKARLHAMISNRPDWTLSRQRQWACRCRCLSARKHGSCIRARWNCWKPSRRRSSRAVSRHGKKSMCLNCRAQTPSTTRRSRTRSTYGLTRFDARNGYARIARGPTRFSGRPLSRGL